VYDPEMSAAGKTVSKWGGFFDGLEQFDASFFGISPREAMAMDPRGRMLLETGWECAEDAGLAPLALERDAEHTVGVYVGTWPSEYGERVQEEQLLQYVGVGTAPSAAAGRVSYFFGLTGNCVSIDTACSSSLVALVQGAQAVSSGREEIALCFGTNSLCSASGFVVNSKLGMLSPDGRCKTFDASANGYVRAEGCGAVLLRREECRGAWASGRVCGESGWAQQRTDCTKRAVAGAADSRSAVESRGRRRRA
jgi:acyl transferase domain-containing protein